jgi:hypothetical protein
MSSLRTAARLTGRMATGLAMPKPSLARPMMGATKAVSGYQARTLTFSKKRPLKKSEVIKEEEIPVSVYSPDAKGVGSANAADHFTVPVPQDAKANLADPADEEPMQTVTPLDASVFKSMPRTMQSMTVMDKVIIITG